MKITYEVKGMKKLIEKIDRIAEFMPKLQTVMFAISLQVANDARDFVTGRQALDKYQKEAASEASSEFTGAVANESLGVITNRLRGSIFGAVEDITKDYISAIVRTNVEYALIHELGGIIVTKYAVINMPARPYMYASLLKNKNWIINTLNKAIKELLK